MLFTRIAALLAAACLVSMAAPPRRILSTSPGITEILFALGLGDRVVGVTQYCKYPPEVAKIPKIGSWAATNMEAVLAARPNVVVLQRTTVHTSKPYHAVGLRTLEVRLDTFADIHAAIATIAADAGVSERGKELNASIQRDLDAVRARVAAAPRVAVLFVVGRNPGSLEGIVAAAGNSYLSEAIGFAGGRNIFADARLPYSKVVQEEIVARDPEVIIDMGEHADATALSKQQIAAEVALWQKFPTVRAVRNGRINIVSSEVFVVPGPRVGEMVRTVARLLHPRLF